MTPHEAARRMARVGLFGCVLACLLGAHAPAQATHVFVEPGNLSAYQTIQAALDAQAAVFGAIETVFVAPGAYPESLVMREVYDPDARLIGTGGAQQTRVRTLRYGHTDGGVAIQGLTFDEPVVSLSESPGHPDRPPVFRNCVFEAGANFGAYPCTSPNFFDCTFRGNTVLYSYTTAGQPGFSGLRFERCRLTVTAICGILKFSDCVFTGAPDTAIVFQSLPENVITFERCVIESTAVGLATNSSETALSLVDCDVRDTGIGLDLYTPISRYASTALTLSQTNFDRVGRAVRATSPWALYVDHVIVRDCAGPAFEAKTTSATMAAVSIERAGAGLLLQGVNPTWPNGAMFFGASLDSCQVSDAAGDGIRVIAVPTTSGRVRVEHATVSGVAGRGIHVNARGATIANSLVHDVQGDGISLKQLAPAAPDSILSNTVALAQGRGIALERDTGVLASSALLSNNIAVFSGEAGLSVGTFAAATVQQNDAWQNSLGDFENVTSPLASNLSANPLFCAVGSGDFTLQSGSPCAPSGVYGLIGARPVGCATAPVGVDSRGPALALSVGPNPSLGGVRFALPSREEAGEIEVLDLAGRRVWSAAVAPRTESLEWNGRASGVRASGVFFARVTRGGESVTRRFVLLR